jgi:GNAT superfamily N-acetyltransferase
VNPDPARAGVRRATGADAGALARIQVRAWHHAFADVVFPEHTPTAEDQTAFWASALDADVTAMVAGVGDEIHAFVAFGPVRDPDDQETDLGEIVALFVDPVAQGAGLGGMLLDAAEDELRGRGHTAAVLWTLEAALARDLYERRGWVQDRDAVPEHGALGVAEVRYRKPLRA